MLSLKLCPLPSQVYSGVSVSKSQNLTLESPDPVANFLPSPKE